MANETRVRADFVSGTVDDNPLTAGATTLTSTELADLPAISSSEHAVIVLDPDGTQEIVYVTAHTASATTATILRGQEGTTAVSHAQNTSWVHGPVASDYSPWDLAVDESGTSIANWTSVAGTWAADAGGYIKQTDTTNAYRGLRLTADVVAGPGLVVEAEVRFPSSASTLRRAMFGLSVSGSVSATSDPWVGLQEGTTEGYVFQRGDQDAVILTATINEDTWYTVRVEQVGLLHSLSVDGTYVGAYRITPGQSLVAANRLMLVSYSGEVDFRNVRAWRQIPPS